ncbi:hypothetical protein [Anaerostipes sp. PC18]|uniref:hypothetical protein n=1 Tax=Anaerostipes sp. PC18 TaxID=3036926 RepID=UPI00308B29D3|nr:hypothetical protein P8F77_04375 [Anaerostipes sp. PC18]
MNENKKILSIDAETNGLYGDAFAIGAILMDKETGKEEKRFLARCHIYGDVDPFVRENVLPQMKTIENTHLHYGRMLIDFIDFFKENKENADVIVHMGVPVEAKLFIDAERYNFMGPFDGPYPLVDIAAYPEIWDSVDGYNAKHRIEVPDCDGGTHNPLYDCYAAALAYRHVRGFK